MFNKLHILISGFILTFLLTACGTGGGENNGGTTNHAPVLSAIANVAIVAGNNQNISLTATDQDNDAASFSVSGGSALTVNATISGNSLTIIPAPGYVTVSPITFTVTASDGKGGTDVKTFSATVTAQTKAILKVSTANIPTGTAIYGTKLSIVLPAGVTPSTWSVTDASLSVVASGNAPPAVWSAYAGYSPVSNTLMPTIINTTGASFASGEFMTINCSIAAGTTLTATDFQASAIEVYDLNLNSIPGATCPISVTFQ